MKFSLSILLFSVCTFFLSCQSPQKNIALDAESLHHWNELLEEAIGNDFFSPPVAGRIYSYPNIAAYEVLAQSNNRFTPLSEQFQDLNISAFSKDVHVEVAAICAFYSTSIELVYSIENLEQSFQDFQSDLLQQGLSEKEFQQANEYGKSVAAGRTA